MKSHWPLYILAAEDGESGHSFDSAEMGGYSP